MITTWFGLCSSFSIISWNAEETSRCQVQSKLTILFKYTVINHVTGVSPSTVCMLLAWQLGKPQGL